MERCRLCYGRVVNGRCVDCGLDNSKSDKNYRLNTHNPKSVRMHGGDCDAHVNKETPRTVPTGSARARQLKKRQATGTVQRKKGKTILLLIVLILVNSMILGTSMILRTTNESKQAMQEKTNSKIVAEITSKDSKITENEVNKIETLEDVSSINRIGRQEVFPNNFAPVTLNTSTNEENLKIALLSYDDLEKDSPFSEMQYRLASGDYIKREKKGAVINANLANQNELKVGDTIELSTENGTKVSVQIIGIFMSAGNAEKDQPSETTAVNRIENQIFIDNSTYKELFKEAEFEKICIYSKRPEKSYAGTYIGNWYCCCFPAVMYVDADKAKRGGNLYEPRQDKK